MTNEMFKQIYDLLTGCVILLSFILIFVLIIAFCVFWYLCAKNTEIKKQNDDDNLRNIIKDELRRIDRAMYYSNKYIDFLEKEKCKNE